MKKFMSRAQFVCVENHDSISKGHLCMRCTYECWRELFACMVFQIRTCDLILCGYTRCLSVGANCILSTCVFHTKVFLCIMLCLYLCLLLKQSWRLLGIFTNISSSMIGPSSWSSIVIKYVQNLSAPWIFFLLSHNNFL